MFKQSIGTTKPNFPVRMSELGRYDQTLTAGSVSGSTRDGLELKHTRSSLVEGKTRGKNYI